MARLTTEQRERLVGMVLMGAATETARACLGVSAADVLETEDEDRVFLQALYMARCCSEEFRHTMSGVEGGKD